MQTRSAKGNSRSQRGEDANTEINDDSLQLDPHGQNNDHSASPGALLTQSTQPAPLYSTPTQQSPPNIITDSALNLLLEKFRTVENKLEKLDSMEKQLGKLDVIETKTNSIDTEIHNIKKSVESIYSDLDTLKGKVRENQDSLRKEMEDFKSQQEVRFAEAVSTIRKEVTQEAQEHFKAFTEHIESAFVKEQAFSRKKNLIFTGIQESKDRSDVSSIRTVCHRFLGVSNLWIDSVYRLGEEREGSNSPRPLLVQFHETADRTRIWQAKKHFQKAPGGKIWVQEDMPRGLKEDLRVLLRVARHADSLQKEEFKGIKVKDFQLAYNGKRYSASKLESLPPELRPSSLCLRGTNESIAFFGKYTPLSNHHQSPFRVKGVLYNTVEQYLAVARASLSDREDMRTRAMEETNPADSKKILNALKTDHVQEWEEQRASVLMVALRSKFRQNPLLAEYLKETYPLLLGEASKDPIWGTGLTLTDGETTDHTKWSAQGNLLGRSLMEVRKELLG